VVQLSLVDFCYDVKLKLGNVCMTQFPVNSNIATAGHKVQGMSKDLLIVNSWKYGFPNWVYVVLSTVHTLSGLHLCQPLDLTCGHLKCQRNFSSLSRGGESVNRHFWKGGSQRWRLN